MLDTIYIGLWGIEKYAIKKKLIGNKICQHFLHMKT